MNDVVLQQKVERSVTHTSYVHELFDKAERILQNHRHENPDLYRKVEEEKILKEAKAKKSLAPVIITSKKDDEASATELIESIYFKQFNQKKLIAEIESSHRLIHEHHVATHSLIVPRTQARNAKQAYSNVESETSDRADKLSAQIQTWRSVLPVLIRRFSKIPDPRRVKSVKHQLVVVMLYGLLAFIFRLSSRREINRTLSGAVVFENLQKIFPELETIPHADTLSRVLEKINVNGIERTHMHLIEQLIRNKKFKKLLISGCLPIAIDGTQKLYRDGELHDLRWLSRKVGNDDNQQYVYVLEANIVFKNGLTIPLLTEYLKTNWNVLINPEGKQDCELVAFKRLASKLKKYFPRLKIILFADALFATQSILEILPGYHWEYVIQFSKNKLKQFAELITTKKDTAMSIPGQPYYRERHQEFYWYNDVTWGHALQLKLHLVSCIEKWKEVDKKTGKIVFKYSQHQWLSSIRIGIQNVHELCNLGARKIGLMEDSINTEKHRGYHYEHAFSYDWNAMQGFHLLMRLAHAVNALSEFTKKLKKWIKERGCSATLKLIKETIFNPWLPNVWYEQENKKPIRLILQLE